MAVIADTGPLFAAMNTTDRFHHESADLLRSVRESILVPIGVVIEVCRLARTRLSAAHEVRFLNACTAGELDVLFLNEGDFRRASELADQYASAAIGFVDASMVALAERLNITRLLTLDRRDFSIIRPRHCAAFELLPE